MLIWKMLRFASITGVASCLLWSLAGAGDLATVKVPVKTELYASDPQPLTPAECGQCHQTHFGNLRSAGGKHRFACQECHRSFHAYNPGKGLGAYQELMPKCASCHDRPHGKAFADCASCHHDPHAIKRPVTGKRLAGACAACHPGPQAELVANPSKHTQVACASCHTTHGFKPGCNSCHQPHYPAQDFDSCRRCHQVHQPKMVTYGSDTQNQECASCHAKVVARLQNSPSKHAAVSCATCHQARHKAVPKCAECHEAPHPQVFLERYPTCLTCHMDPHNLPVSRK